MIYTTQTNEGFEAALLLGMISHDRIVEIMCDCWEINIISSKTEKKKETVTEMKDDGKGNMVKEEKKVERVYLYITGGRRKKITC